jgi:histone deacetylase complex regulatory component SIN3
MYCGNTHFLLLRLHAILCQRLEIIRDKAAALLKEWQLSNPTEKDTSSIGSVPTLGIEVEEYYRAFLELVKAFYDGNVENGIYEETLREMFTTSAYHAFTMDRLVQSIAKFSIGTFLSLFNFFSNQTRNNAKRIRIEHSPIPPRGK